MFSSCRSARFSPDHGRLYQPAITRLPSLLCLLVFTLSLIVLTELACRRLPQAKNDGIMTTMGDRISPRLARRVLDSRNPGPSPQQDSANLTDSADSAQGTTSVALDAGPANYLPLGSEKSTAAAASSAYLHISSTEPAPAESTTIPASTKTLEASHGAYLPVSLTDPLPADTTSIRPIADPSAFLPVSLTPPPSSSTLLPVQDDNRASASPAAPTSTPLMTVGDPPPSAFLPLSSTDASKAQTEMIPSSDFLPLAQGTSTPASQQPSLRPPSSPSVPNASSPTTASGTAFQATTNNFGPFTLGATALPVQTGLFQGETYSVGPDGAVIIGGVTLATGAPATATLADGKVVTVTPGAIAPPARTGNSTPTTATLSDGKVVVVTPGMTAPPVQTGIFQGENYSVGPNGIVVIDGTTFATATPTTATLADGKVVVVWPSGSISVQDGKKHAPKWKTAVTAREYVLGAFVPTLLAVLFSIPWHLLASAIKEMEPFYQLQQPDGVAAENSIALDYRASINIVATFNAIRKGHFLVWWSGLVSLVVLLIAPLSSETVFIGFDGKCTATSGRDACSPSLSVYPIAARVLQGMLTFIAILTLALAIAILRGRSGVYANPLSIAGLSTLFQNPHAIESFRRLNPYCTSSNMIRAALQGYRYRIDSYLDDDGVNSYGLVISSQQPDVVQTNSRTSFHKGQKYATVAVNAVEEHRRPERQRKFSSFFVHPTAIVAFALFVAGLEILVIYYHKTGGDTGFEKFMDSQSFGVGFLFTAVGVMVKMYWCLLDDETRNMEPYRQLLAGGAKASDSILLAPHTNPFTGFFYSLRNGHIFNSYISLVAILCEPLIIALSNIPFKAGLAYTAYRASSYVTIGILSMILVGIIWMLCRKRMPHLVRRPDTVASVLLFLCGSSMLEDFKGMALMDGQERDAIINRWDKRYAIGTVVGVDGVEREGIDESLFVSESTR